MNFIPVNEPLLTGSEWNYVKDCIKSGWVSSAGKYIELFEKSFASYCTRKYGIAVSNGTAALQLAVKALDLPPDSEIIMPSFTIISCPLAAIYNHLTPVLVDSDPETWCMNVDHIEKKINDKTSAVMVVHIYGHPVDMDPVLRLAERYSLKIVEDAAEVHCAEYKGKKCGSFGDISGFSFYANKIITTGEGGMVLTDSAEYNEKVRSLRDLCFQKERRFYHEELGYNFRLTNVQAAIGLAQLERIEELVEKKRWIGHTYTEKLKNIEGLSLPVEKNWAKNVYWMYGIVLDEETGFDAKEFAKRLKEKGIDTRPFFLGIHEQPVFHRMGLFKDDHYPVASRISRQGLYLPSGLTLKEEQINRITEEVKKLLTT